jgi:hypothetical protein
MTEQSVLYNHASNYGAQGVFHDAVTMNVTVTEGGTYLQQAQHPPPIERHPSRPRPPRALRSFRNREHALELLRAELRADGAAWLNGWRGAGLTALLTQIANDPQARALPDGVLYVNGRFQMQHPDDVLQHLFERFYTSVTTVRVTPGTACAYLAQLEALLLLDGLPLTAHELEQLANDVRPNAVLLTADGPAPDTFGEITVQTLPRDDAQHLLADHARLSLPLSSNIDDLCAALSDTPLPLVLAGTFIRERQIEPAYLHTALQQAASETTDGAALERILRVVLDSLEPPARDVLAVLTRTAHPVADHAMISAVSQVSAAETATILEDLMRLGLVTGGNDRYQIGSRSVQRVLDIVLPAGQERQRAAAYLVLALPVSGQTPTWLLFQRDNLLAAAETLLSSGRPTEAARLAQAVHPTTVQQGHWGAWQQVVQMSSEAARHSGDAALQAWALHEQGTRAGLRGDMENAATSLREAEQIRQRLGDLNGAAVSHNNLRMLGLLAPPGPPERHMPRAALAGIGTVVVMLILWLMMSMPEWLLGAPATPTPTPASVAVQATPSASPTPPPTPTPTPTPQNETVPPPSPTPTLPPPTATLPPPTATLPPPTATLPPPTATLPPPSPTAPPPIPQPIPAPVLDAPRGLAPDNGVFFGRCGQGLRIAGSMDNYDGPVVFYEWQVAERDEGGTSVQTETTQALYLERKQMPCNILIVLRARAIVGEIERLVGPFSEPVQVIFIARPDTPTRTLRPTRTPTTLRLQIAPTPTPPQLQAAPTPTIEYVPVP